MGDDIGVLPRGIFTKMADRASSNYRKELGGGRLVVHCFPNWQVPALCVSVHNARPADDDWNYSSAWIENPCQDTLALFYTGIEDDFMAPLIDWLQEHNTDEYNAGVLERAALLYCQ